MPWAVSSTRDARGFRPRSDVRAGAKTHHGYMSTATFTSIQGGPGGATSLSDSRPRYGLGGVLRAAKVFAAAAVSVVVLGEYAEDAGVVRR